MKIESLNFSHLSEWQLPIYSMESSPQNIDVSISHSLKNSPPKIWPWVLLGCAVIGGVIVWVYRKQILAWCRKLFAKTPNVINS